MKKDGSSKGLCLEFCTLRTFYNKSSALRRTGQENPNCVKTNMIVQKHVSKFLSKVQVYEQRPPGKNQCPYELFFHWKPAYVEAKHLNI